MNDKERFELYQGQVQTYASFSGAMAGVVMFFTGIILTGYTNYDVSIKIPIAFLLVSIFGFLYGTLLYTNASEEVSNYNEEGFRRAIFLGDLISEYLGVYLLVIAIPLTINIVTDDLFLRVVTLLASIVGLAVYQFSKFSMIERHFPRRYQATSVLILIMGVLLFLSQAGTARYFMVLAVIFMVFLTILTYIASKNFKK